MTLTLETLLRNANWNFNQRFVFLDGNWNVNLRRRTLQGIFRALIYEWKSSWDEKWDSNVGVSPACRRCFLKLNLYLTNLWRKDLWITSLIIIRDRRVFWDNFPFLRIFMVQSFSRFSKQYDFYRFKRNFNIKLKRENAYTMALLYFPRT